MRLHHLRLSSIHIRCLSHSDTHTWCFLFFISTFIHIFICWYILIFLCKWVSSLWFLSTLQTFKNVSCFIFAIFFSFLPFRLNLPKDRHYCYKICTSLKVHCILLCNFLTSSLIFICFSKNTKYKVFYLWEMIFFTSLSKSCFHLFKIF
jgi:hypothetical protein